MSVQLDMFLKNNEIALEEVKQTRANLNKVRRGLFAQIGELQKAYDELKQDIERLERLLENEK